MWGTSKFRYPNQSGGTNGGTKLKSKMLALAFMRVARHLSIDASSTKPLGKEFLFTFTTPLGPKPGGVFHSGQRWLHGDCSGRE